MLLNCERLFLISCLMLILISCSGNEDQNIDGDLDSVENEAEIIDGDLEADSEEPPVIDGDKDLEEDAEALEEEVETEMQFVNCSAEVDLESVQTRQYSMAPFVINPRQDGVTIQWEATDNAPSYLLIGDKDGEYTTCYCVETPIRIPIDTDEIDEVHDAWLYRAEIHGLKSHTQYRYTLAGAETPIPDDYVVLIGNEPEYEAFGEASFVTAPALDDSFSMIILGDTQGLPNMHLSVVQRLVKHPVDVLLHTGDIVHNGTIQQYRGYLMLQSLFIRNVPHFHIAGNHEQSGPVIPFDTIFPIPQLASEVEVEGTMVKAGPRTGIMDYGSVRIFVLDSEETITYGTKQLIWLDQALEDTVKNHPEFKYLFGAWHRPTYSGADSRYLSSKEALHEVATRWQMDAVFNGHNHCYERFLQDDITYIVTGGAGAILTPIDSGSLLEDDNRLAGETSLHFVKAQIKTDSATFSAIRVSDGEELDSFSLTPKDRSNLR